MKPDDNEQQQRRQRFLEYLKKVRNEALVASARRLVDAGAKFGAERERLILSIRGKKRRVNFNVYLDHATVWQQTRFDGDMTFWRENLCGITPDLMGASHSLQFPLTTQEHFTKFERLVIR